MTKEFIPYEQALALKELGFDEPCFATYEFRKLFIGEFKNSLSFDLCKKTEVFPAPTFSQAFRWFREKHGLFVAPSVISYEGGPYLWFFEINSTNLPFGTDLGVTDDFKTYEEAEIACLIRLIEIVKDKKP